MNIINEFHNICKTQNIIQLINFLEKKKLLRINNKFIICYIINYNISDDMIKLILKNNLNINHKTNNFTLFEKLISRSYFFYDYQNNEKKMYLIPFLKYVPEIQKIIFYKIKKNLEQNLDIYLNYNNKQISLLSILYYRNIYRLNLILPKNLENIIIIKIKKNIQNNCEKLLKNNIYNWINIYKFINNLKKEYHIPLILKKKIFKYHI